MENLRYPIGRFDARRPVAPADHPGLIERIANAPTELRTAVLDLSEAQLDTRYRDGGWTIRQVVHHVPDSHLNAYIRFKWTLTEDAPLIKVYDQKRWAELPDTRDTPIATSLALLDALHERWVALLRAMSPADFARTLDHPEMGTLPLSIMLALYAWHGAHHVAHVSSLRQREGW
jgi:uncharacterized damage-inducible protein DinB